MSSADARMTRRGYLVMKVMMDAEDRDEPISVLTALEAVSSVAIEHPEWDLEEKKTWAEWEAK